MINRIVSLKNHQGFIKYFFNTSWLFAEQFLRILSGLFVGVWVARYLGPGQFGIFSYALAFTAIFGGIAKLGLDSVLVRDLVNNPQKIKIYLGTAFWLKIAGAIIVFGIMATILPFTSNDTLTNIFIFIIASGLIFQSFEVVEFYFHSQVLAKIVTVCKVIQLTISTLIKIYLILIEAELIWFVCVIVFDSFSLAISYFIAYKMNKNPHFFQSFNIKIAKDLLKSSWPLIFSGIVVGIYMRIDQIMIKEMLGEYDVGIYSAAVKLSEAFYFIPMLITSSLFPAILNAKKQSDELYNNRLQRLYTFMIWTAIIIALIMTLLSDWVIVLLYGEVFYYAGQILKIHVWSGIFVFLGMASSNWYLTENLQKLNLLNTSIGALLNVILNFTLISAFGVIGAAYSTVVSYAVAAYLMNFVWRDSRKNFYMLNKGFLLNNIINEKKYK